MKKVLLTVFSVCLLAMMIGTVFATHSPVHNAWFTYPNDPEDPEDGAYQWVSNSWRLPPTYPYAYHYHWCGYTEGEYCGYVYDAFYNGSLYDCTSFNQARNPWNIDDTIWSSSKTAYPISGHSVHVGWEVWACPNGGYWYGQDNTYVELWCAFLNDNGTYHNTGSSSLHFAEIQLYLYQEGIWSISEGSMGGQVRSDGSEQWYQIYYHADQVSTSSFTNDWRCLDSVFSYLDTNYDIGLDMNKCYIWGISLGTEVMAAEGGSLWNTVALNIEEA